MHNYLHNAAAAIVLGLAGGFAAQAAVPNLAKDRIAEASHWADSVYSTLTERQRVAQLMFPKVVPTKGEKSKAAITREVKTDGVGGLLFTEGSISEFAQMTDWAQAEAKVPVLMTLDGEWGLSMRVKNTPRFPHNMGLGAISDYKLLYRYGQEVARECKLMGIHTNFAPDADVNSNPANPVIGYRSFGENPQRVASATVAYSLGLEDGGVQAVSKHFPGHGDTSIDSHKAFTSVNHDKKRLDEIDLVPFKEFIGAGCSGIMVGHIAVPAIDPSGMPASLSQVLTDKLLRKELGFEGLIYTDALEMKGATHPAGTNNCVAAIKAGADALLCSGTSRPNIDAVMAALADGTLSKADIEDRCKRVLRYKYLLGLPQQKAIANPNLEKDLNTPEAEALIKELAAASITVLENKDGILPLGKLGERTFAVVSIGADSKNQFAATCRHYGRVDTYFTTGSAFSAATLAKIEKADVVIAAVFDDKATSRSALAKLASTKKPLVEVFMVNPFKMKKFAASLPKAHALVLAYDDIPATRISAAEAIFGGIAVSGKLPVNLNGIAPIGTGIELPKTRLGFSSPVAEGLRPSLTDSIDALVQTGLKTKAFPGCQVLIARNGNIVYNKAFGKTSSTPGAPAVDKSTIYDLASVSKATGTLPGIMKAYDSGLISLDDRLGDIIPEITDSAKRLITIRELLYHETGMPAALNLYDVMMDTNTFTGRLITGKADRNHSIKIQRGAYGHNTAKMRTDIVRRQATPDFPVEASKGIFTGKATYDTIMSRIYNAPLRKNKNYNYSCLNFSLLMDVEQRRSGVPHQIYVEKGIFGPVGAYRTGYRPTERFPLDEIASTENDTFLRRQKLHGYVHDELANFSGGVQGNAGLFANADDLAKICQMWLNGGLYGDVQVLSPQTVELFTTAKSPTCRRGLGFDKPDTERPDWSPTCDEASPEVFGHLGFTGTVFWVDPKEKIIFIFLTNRVDPTRDTPAFNRLNIRPRIFSQVYQAIER